MKRALMLRVLTVLILADLVRNFADYESYSTFISYFLNEVLDEHGQDAELFERCLETMVE